jgi:pre-rRNA-processing protein TSR1
MGEQRHRPGSLKQQNKAHKHGKHKSKGAIQSVHKGRVALKVATKTQKGLTRKEDRRNQLRQQRKSKRAVAMEEKRSKGGLGGCPHVIAVIPLHDKVSDVANILKFLLSSDKDAVVHNYSSGRTLMCPKIKQRFTLVVPSYSDLYCCLDTAKVADTLLFVYAASHDPVDSFGDLLLTCLFAQGLPASSHIVQGLDQVPLKHKGALKKTLQQTVEKRFPKEKIQQLDSESDGAKLLRLIGMQKSRHVTWRDRRAHLLAEQVQFDCLTENTDYGTLRVSGYLRGQSLSVNGLVHLPGIGDFQMSCIDGPRDPCPISRPLVFQTAMQTEEEDISMEEDVKVLQAANPAVQESLQSEVIPDPMEGEQTWPTDDELKEAESYCEKRGATKHVPEGTSDYQAAWIIDSCSEDEVGN